MIDEQRLQTALDKLSTLRQQTKAKMKQLDQLYDSVITIRRIRKVEFDEEGKEIPNTESFEKPVDRATFEQISDARRQEVYDKIVAVIEALR